MNNKILIFGAGGLCKQILNNYTFNNYYIYQDTGEFDEFFLKYKTTKSLEKNFTHFIIAVAGPKIRKIITDKLLDLNLKPLIFLNSKDVSNDSIIENNTIILQNVFIEPSVEIKEGSLLNVSTKIFHDVKIGKFCEIAPNTLILGKAQIGDYTFIGAGSIILPKIKIGRNCIIGAGSVVTKDIPDNQVWFGNPAKFKYNKI